LFPPLALLDFRTGTPGGECGQGRDSGGDTVRSLSCGGLNIGGGQSSLGEGAIPDGATNRFVLSCDAAGLCDVGPIGLATDDYDCTAEGCLFGPPLPVVNPTLQALNTCVVNRFAADTDGAFDLATGETSDLEISLASNVFLTGPFYFFEKDGDVVLDQPCPLCTSDGNPANALSGTPENPASGVCSNGANVGGACVTTNSTGLSRDCPPGGVGEGAPCTPDGTSSCTHGSTNLGDLAVNLSPLSTATVSATNADGLFCPGQGGANAGCFGTNVSAEECTSITEVGSPAGLLSLEVPAAAKLASVFCIPATGDAAVDGAGGLPGPGATTLTGTFTLHEVVEE